MVALRLLLQPLLGNEFPFITFFPAVFLATWWGGWWPSLAATLLSAALTLVLAIAPPGSSASLSNLELTGALLFVSIGIATGALGESCSRSLPRRRSRMSGSTRKAPGCSRRCSSCTVPGSASSRW